MVFNYFPFDYSFKAHGAKPAQLLRSREITLGDLVLFRLTTPAEVLDKCWTNHKWCLYLPTESVLMEHFCDDPARIGVNVVQISRSCYPS